MRKVSFSLLAIICGSLALPLFGSSCARCDEARENNKKRPAPPHYYEDYLNQAVEEKAGTEAKTPEQTATQGATGS